MFPQDIKVGKIVRIKSQGITVVGMISSCNFTYDFSVSPALMDGGWFEVLNEVTWKTHYWVSDIDGGTIEVLS